MSTRCDADVHHGALSLTERFAHRGRTERRCLDQAVPTAVFERRLQIRPSKTCSSDSSDNKVWSPRGITIYDNGECRQAVIPPGVAEP